jgi:hypothetical protein
MLLQPFHMHISPIMVAGGDCGGNVDYYEVGEFFDTIQARCPTLFKSVWYPTTKIMVSSISCSVTRVVCVSFFTHLNLLC